MSQQQQQQKLHIYFFPLLAPSHMILVVDMARQFARHDPTNVKATIVLPHFNVPQFLPTIERDRQQGSDITIRQVSFPKPRVDVLDDAASLDPPRMSVESLEPDRPDCIVSDFFISWTADLASELKIPRIAVHVSGFFPLCVHHNLIKHTPHKGLKSLPDTTFVVPGLPDVVRTTYRQLARFVLLDENPESPIMANAKKAASTSYGFLFNTFRELEPDYADYYKTHIGSKAWHVGPVSLCNTNPIDKARRGGAENEDEEHNFVCLEWLNGRNRKSVVYVCFGTMSSFEARQINEIAVGLESCGHDFIWVVKGLETLPDGFEERIESSGRGLIVKSWVPQVLILEHESVGGFLTHCGWSSLVEGVAAGKPMVAWPISAEQFENEKLVTEILKIGVDVGCVEWSERLDVKKILIRGERIAKAVSDVMGSGGEEMRKRAMALSDKAKKAVEVGGSSYNDMDSLLKELRSIKDGKLVLDL